MSRITRRFLGFSVALLLTLLIAAVGALAQTGSEETQGSQLLQSVQQGERSCGDFSDSDFELIGEAWMGQMFGSSETHESMNRLMSSMMGSSGEERMHEYMGRQVSGCGGGSPPSGFGQMMSGVRGMIGMMGGYPGSGGTTGMMGDQGASGGPGSMMDGSSDNASDDDNDASGWVVAVMVAIIVLILAAIYFVLRGSRTRRTDATPAEILQRRFASGEINQDDYERRLNLLGDRK